MKKNLIVFTFALAAASWVTACGKANTDFPQPPAEAVVSETAETPETTAPAVTEFSTGSWDGYTFTSPWLNINFTFPEDCTIGTEEDIKRITGAGQEVLVNNDIVKESQTKISDFTTVYDFMVTLPDQISNIQLLHENVSIATLGKGISEEDYIKTLEEQLKLLTDFQYEISDTETVELGGRTFTKLPVSALGGAMLQEYYCISNGKYISSLIVTYVPESADTVQSIIEGITVAQ